MPVSYDSHAREKPLPPFGVLSPRPALTSPPKEVKTAGFQPVGTTGSPMAMRPLIRGIRGLKVLVGSGGFRCGNAGRRIF